jgi:hypothetical protein
MRMNPALVADRCQLLRTWTTDELLELEDVRGILEGLLATELCPTDGEVFWRRGSDAWSKHFYDPTGGRRGPNTASIHSIFHDSRTNAIENSGKAMPATQLRHQSMDGWGDDIVQYHALGSMLKLNPAQIMWLYDHAITKRDVELFVEDKVGGHWFWNNGETMLHTWILVLYGRGVPVEEVREKVYRGLAGIAVDI